MPIVNSDLYRAFGRLGNRLRLKDQPAGTGVSSDVVAVTNFDALLETIVGAEDVLDLSGSPGAEKTAYTVPAGERWHVHYFRLEAVTAGSYMWIYVSGQKLDLDTTATGAHIVFPESGPITLQPGDTIGARATGDGADNARSLFIYYRMEDSY